MAYLVEVVARGYYSRRNGVVQELSIGDQFPVKNKPPSWGSKVRVIKEVNDSELIINDGPLAAALREDGEDEKADKANATEGKKKPKAKAKAKAETETETETENKRPRRPRKEPDTD